MGRLMGILGIILLVFAGILLFVGLCLGDRCDWSEDGTFIFWLIVAGLSLILFEGSR